MLRARNGAFEPMNRWPSLIAPASTPPTSNGVTSPSKVQTMRCSGRTQRRSPEPQVIDLGQGNSRTMAGTISAMISPVGRPLRSMMA